MDRVRFAYVGLTHMHASGYLESLRLMPEAEVAALCDPDPDAARPTLPPQLANCPLYDDLGSLEHPSWSTAPERTIAFTLPAVGGYGGAGGQASLRGFIASFREDAPPMFDVGDARRVLEIIDAAHRSAESGRVVATR